MSEKTDALEELAELLTYNEKYLRMLAKRQQGYTAGDRLTEEMCASIAKQVRRPWPPEGS